MRTLIHLAILSTLLIGSIMIGSAATTTSYALSETISAHDDCYKKRGRKRDKCLSKKRRSRTNRNSNSNANGNSNSNSNSNRRNSGKAISVERARGIALRRVPGTVIKQELESEHGRDAYEFYIRNRQGSFYEVYVDAHNGNVLKIERKRH